MNGDATARLISGELGAFDGPRSLIPIHPHALYRCRVLAHLQDRERLRLNEFLVLGDLTNWRPKGLLTALQEGAE